jgi:hypothetical protein
MSTIHHRHPRLVPALLVSGAGGAILLWFMMAQRLQWFTIAPAMSIIHSTYYLGRLFQRRHVFKIDQDAPEAWPYTILFPGKQERSNLTSGVVAMAYLYCLFGSAITVTILCAPKGYYTNIAVFGLVYLAQWITIVVVGIEALKVRIVEDSVMCERTHAWVCQRCQVEENEFDEIDAQMRTRRPRIGIVLASSSLLSLSLLYFGYVRWFTEAPAVCGMASVLIAATLLHHAYFGIRLFRTPDTRRQGEGWPLTPIFPGLVGTLYGTATRGLGMSYLAMTILVAGSLYNLDSFTYSSATALAAVVLCALEALVLLRAASQGLDMTKTENKAQCVREGHSWKCSRICSATQETASPDVEKVRACMIIKRERTDRVLAGRWRYTVLTIDSRELILVVCRVIVLSSSMYMLPYTCCVHTVCISM